MKKIFLILGLFMALLSNAQSLPITALNNLKLTAPVSGTKNDSILVWRGGGDKVVRFLPVSSIASGGGGGVATVTGTLVTGTSTDPVINIPTLQQISDESSGSIPLVNTTISGTATGSDNYYEMSNNGIDFHNDVANQSTGIGPGYLQIANSNTGYTTSVAGAGLIFQNSTGTVLLQSNQSDVNGTVNIKNVAGGTEELAFVSDIPAAGVQSVTGNLVDNTDPLNPVVLDVDLNIHSFPTEIVIGSNSGISATIPLADATNSGLESPAQFTKLAGIASGATANSTDAFLLARANHTGTQLAITISDFNTAVASTAVLKTNNLSDLGSASTARTNLGLGTLATQNGTFSGTSSGTNTGDQTITLTGAVTGSGTGSFSTTLASGIDAAKIGDGSVSTTEFQYINSVTSNVQAQINTNSTNISTNAAAVAAISGRILHTGNSTVTGVIIPTIAISMLVPANTYTSSDSFEIIVTFNKSTTATAVNYNLYHDTTINGTTNAIATGIQLSTTNRCGAYSRILELAGGTAYNGQASSSVSMTPYVASSGIPTTTTFNPTVNNYITLQVSGLTVVTETSTVTLTIRPLK